MSGGPWDLVGLGDAERRAVWLWTGGNAPDEMLHCVCARWCRASQVVLV